MNQKNRPLAIFIAILLVLNLFVSFFLSKNGFVKAQPGVEPGEELQIQQIEAGVNAEVNEVPGGPGFIMIHPYQFRLRYSNQPWQFLFSYLYNPSSNEYSYMAAPLNLPHGATITQLTLYYKDNSPKNMSIRLKAYSGNLEATMAGIYTDEEENIIQSVFDNTVNFSVVDNQNYSYALELDFEPGGSTNLFLTNVRIDYAYNSNLPLINK